MEGLYDLFRENKGADQLCLCFRICLKQVSHDTTYISPVISKPAFCICENKGADQLRNYKGAFAFAT